MNLEGEKISTSRNWAVWLHEYLIDFPDMQDELRYCLITNLPETKDSDFTWKDFQAKNNNELVSIFGNFINRVVVLIDKYFDGKVPENLKSTKSDKEIFHKIENIKSKIETSIEKYRFREAMSLIIDLSRLGNKYLADTEPWKIIKTDEDRVKSILYTSIQIVANIAILCKPLLPFTSIKIFKLLDILSKSWNDSSNNLIQPGHKLGETNHIFSKIEDSVIDNQIEKLKLAINDKKEKIMKLKETIEFDEFSKIDLRIATVIVAENVPESEKLLKLIVDTGIDKRVVLSGISKYYKPEDILNKQVMILVNLKPRKMMGIESQGMLLLAENPDGSLRLMHPDTKATNGSVIV
jgi:methionyl-tRNA synthetase